MEDLQHLTALRRYWKEHHTFPSMAKLAPVLGLAAASSVFSVINRLTDAGYIQRVERRIAPTDRFFTEPASAPRRANTVADAATMLSAGRNGRLYLQLTDTSGPSAVTETLEIVDVVIRSIRRVRR